MTEIYIFWTIDFEFAVMFLIYSLENITQLLLYTFFPEKMTKLDGLKFHLNCLVNEEIFSHHCLQVYSKVCIILHLK